MEYEMRFLGYSRDAKGNKTYHENPYANCVKPPTATQAGYVLVSPKSTNTQNKSIKNTLEDTKTMEIAQKSDGKRLSTLIASLVDFLAKHFQSLENGVDSAIQEVRSSLKSLDALGKSNHAFVCLKTSKGFYLTTKGQLSLPSLPRWMNWGTMSNGKLLTARISECRRTGNECSLSDILEEQVEEKYFLSEKAIKGIFKHIRNHAEKGNGFGATLHQLSPKETTKEETTYYEQTSRIHSPKGISPTVPTSSGGHHIPMVCETVD